MTVFKPGDRVRHLSSLQKGTVVGDRTTWENIAVLFDGDTHPAMTHTSNLEPAGEPMQTDSNTFKHKDTITQVYALAPGELAVNTFGDRYDVKGTQALVDAKDAPALALAVLDAPASNGAPVAPEVARAIAALEEYKQRTQAEAEDAADREKLEAEAVALHKAAGDTSVFPSTWNELLPGSQDTWINVAKRARTLHGVTK